MSFYDYLFTFNELKQALEPLNPKVIGSQDDSEKITQIFTDSRSEQDFKKALFIALKGDFFDGHHFIEFLITKQTRYFVVNNEMCVKKTNGLIFFVVKNTIEALQKLAIFYRNKFDIPVIGVTGSNGKTVVKEWVSQLLFEAHFSIVKSPKSYNSQIGVPLSIFRIKEDHNIGIFEAGISKPNEMQYLQTIINPTIGVLTNIIDAHKENFDSDEHKLIEKLKLFRNSKTIIYGGDNELVHQYIQRYYEGDKKLLSWGRKKYNTLVVDKIQVTSSKTVITFFYEGKQTVIHISFTDIASVENVITCYLIAKFLGIVHRQIISSLTGLKPVSMRLESQIISNNNILINDTYNSDLYSLKIALDFMKKQGQQKKKILFLSEMYQTSLDKKELTNQIRKYVLSYAIDELNLIGENFSEAIVDSFSCVTNKFINTNQAKAYLSTKSYQDSILLLKGARSFEFQKLADEITQSSYASVLEFNIQNLVHNYYVFKKWIGKKVDIMAVVKASAYGSGGVEVSKILEQQGVNHFGVAYIDEGIELRKAGLKSHILVMNSFFQNLEQLLKYNLEPSIFSFEVLDNFIETLNKRRFFLELEMPYSIHIKINTGMNRLGFDVEAIPELIKKLKQHKAILKVKSIFSHLADSGNKEQEAFTIQQFKIFEKACKAIQTSEREIKKHILNSSGIVKYHFAQYDMVRLGIGLYGYTDYKAFNKNLLDTHTLKSKIAQIKTITSEQTVGYNRKERLRKGSKIAVITIGYADGISRKLGNGNWHVIVANQKASIVGNLCMDMIMIDVTNINCRVGEFVQIFGKGNSIRKMAEILETIPYEIIASISSRVRRLIVST